MAAHTESSGKRSWPELVGVKGEEAVETIARENSNVGKVDIVKEGMRVTLDFRADRVRVWVDNSGVVKQPPQIGYQACTRTSTTY